jgi:NAD(P)-dependent dehydrogenase (short-subunit alcohol dehydrogenase family)
MSLRYENKVVIVTGGSKGIGEGIVRAFVREGSTVVFCGRGEAVGKKLESELNAKGPGKTLFISADVSKTADLDNVAETTVKQFGR